MVVDLIVPPLAVVSKTTLVGVVQALAAGGADGLAPALVFIWTVPAVVEGGAYSAGS